MEEWKPARVIVRGGGVQAVMGQKGIAYDVNVLYYVL